MHMVIQHLLSHASLTHHMLRRRTIRKGREKSFMADMMNGAEPGQRFEALDGWRGICALAVALNHLWIMGHYRSVWMVNNFHLFVDYFFVLSGFVISHAYLPTLREARDVGPYLVKRFGRLYPLHLATLMLMFAYEAARMMLPGAGASAPFQGHNSWSGLTVNLFMLQGMGVLGDSQWNGPSWSISVEFFLYVAFALVLIVLGRRWLAIASFVSALCGAAILFLFSAEIMNSTYDFGYFRGLYGFFLGVLLYLNFSRLRVSFGRFGTWAEIAILLVIVTFLSVVGRDYWVMLSTPIFAVAIWIFAQHPGRISALLSAAPGRAVGKWSYSIYLWHFPILYVAAGGLKFIAGKTGWPWFGMAERPQDGARLMAFSFGSPWINDLAALVFLLAVLAVSAFSYRWIERPGQQLFRKLAERIQAGKSGTIVRRDSGERDTIAVSSRTVKARNRV